MKIYTGYFAKVSQYRAAGLVTINIARFNKYYSGASLKLLAPSAEMIHEPESIYIPKYHSILNKLNKSGIINHIKTLSVNKDCILLCYEKPTEFCHRQLVAQWLGDFCSGEYGYIKRSPIKEEQKTIFE